MAVAASIAKRASIELRGAEVRAAGQPGMVMYTTELVVEKKSSAHTSGTWTMQDYLNGDLQLVEMNRGAGANDVGMVAWIMTLKTYEYPAVSDSCDTLFVYTHGFHFNLIFYFVLYFLGPSTGVDCQ